VEVLPCVYGFSATAIHWLGLAAVQPHS